MNPLTIIDLILTDWASPRVRRTVHLLIVLVVALAAIWMAAEGDWWKALGALAVAVYAEANKANTPAGVSDSYSWSEDDDSDYADDADETLPGLS